MLTIDAIQRTWRRLPSRTLIAWLVLVGICLFFGSRHVVGEVSLARVSVAASGMTCDDKPVPLALGSTVDEHGDAASFGSTDEPPVPELVPPLTAKTTCLLSVAISNAGPFSVRVASITLPRMAPGEPGSSVFEAVQAEDGSRPTRRAEDSDAYGDATFAADEEVAGHTTTEWSVNLYYRRDYESCPESLIGESQLPVVRLTSSSASRDVVGDVRLTFHPPTTDANRDSCG